MLILLKSVCAEDHPLLQSKHFVLVLASVVGQSLSTGASTELFMEPSEFPRQFLLNWNGCAILCSWKSSQLYSIFISRNCASPLYPVILLLRPFPFMFPFLLNQGLYLLIVAVASDKISHISEGHS